MNDEAETHTGGSALYEHTPPSCLVSSTDVHSFALSLLILTVYEHIVLGWWLLSFKIRSR